MLLVSDVVIVVRLYLYLIIKLTDEALI